MKPVLTLLCQQANLNDDETVDALGIFHSISTSEFPVTPPPFATLCRFQIEPRDRGQCFDVSVQVQDAWGTCIYERSQAVTVPERPTTDIANAYVGIGCTFKSAGLYSVCVYVDEKFTADVPLHVARN